MTNEIAYEGVGVRMDEGGRCDGSSRSALTSSVFSAFNRGDLLSVSFLFFQLVSNTEYEPYLSGVRTIDKYVSN